MKKLFTSLFLLGMMVPFGASAQFQLKAEAPANPDNAPLPVHPVPSDRQLLWNETEFYAFFHYGMNTFTGSEWGYGNEAESRYAPLAMPNPEQWVTAVKAAGMNGGIAVVKHHDGFCQWPTETTTHNNPTSRKTDIQYRKQHQCPRNKRLRNIEIHTWSNCY